MRTGYLSDERVRELEREYFGPGKPREIDYLAYMMDAANLNDWQRSAFTNMYEGLKDGKYQWLSTKQRASVTRAIHEYAIYTEDVKEGYLIRGWADGVTPVVQKASVPAPKSNRGFDDFDDDIPF